MIIRVRHDIISLQVFTDLEAGPFIIRHAMEDQTDEQRTPGCWHWPPVTGQRQAPTRFAVASDPELEAALNRIASEPRDLVIAIARDLEQIAEIAARHTQEHPEASLR
jgi:hypothetical protein